MKGKRTAHNGSVLIVFLTGMLLLTACAGLPSIKPVSDPAFSKTAQACEKAFPKGKWQFAHVIQATLPGGRDAQLIGVTEVSSSPERIHAVMMTIENLVLFDGVEDGKLTILRSVPPFDNIAFAKGLMEDIRLMFLAPDGEPFVVGLTEEGAQVCRYRVSKDVVIDVTVGPDRKVEIQKYNEERVVRKVVAEPFPVPEKIRFMAYEPARYVLNLRRISAEHIDE